MNSRKPLEVISAQQASDGAGVKLLRVFGGSNSHRFDPFLMLDEFGSEEASDYIAGFPSHPHRGFETITYMLCGKMEHRDHMNNVGLLNDGDVQWMTAGRGVIHSEMPKQTEGKMRGFQLWLNLPAKDKLVPADYTDLPSQQLPSFELAGLSVKAIAGAAQVNDERVKGFFEKESTRPIILDLRFQPAVKASIELPAEHNAMCYVFDGEAYVAGSPLKAQQLMRLSEGEVLEINNSGGKPASILLVAGQPLKEPIVQYGPFVMNTATEIDQALTDFREGRLTG